MSLLFKCCNCDHIGFKFQRYLKDDDFLELFGMTLSDYDALPRWKQLRAKKMVKLF